MGRSRILLLIHIKSCMECLLCAWHCAGLMKHAATPPPPSHPGTACTRPGSPKLTKSPGSDRTECPGVSCSPSASPRDQLAPREQETSSSGRVSRVLIPRASPPGQAHTGLAQCWPLSCPGSTPSQEREQLPADRGQLSDLGQAKFQKLSPLESVIHWTSIDMALSMYQALRRQKDPAGTPAATPILPSQPRMNQQRLLELGLLGKLKRRHS